MGSAGSHPHLRGCAQRCAQEALHPARRGVGNCQRHESASGIQPLAGSKHNEVVLRGGNDGRRGRGAHRARLLRRVPLPTAGGATWALAATRRAHLVHNVRLLVASKLLRPKRCAVSAKRGEREERLAWKGEAARVAGRQRAPSP